MRILRVSLTVLLCVSFAALVGLAVVATRFGIAEWAANTLFWMLAIAGGVPGLFGALLAPAWSVKQRLVLALGGAIFGFALGAGAGFIIKQHPTPLALAVVVPLWGALLGIWLGWLRGAAVPGAVAGLLLLGAITGLGLTLDHPDPATIAGAAAGLVAGSLLCHAERHRPLLWISRGLSFGAFLVVAGTLLLFGVRFWPRMQLYQVAEETSRPPCAMCFTPDGKRALACLDSGIYLWDVKDGKLLNQLLLRRGDVAVSAVCYPTDETGYCIVLDRWGVFTRWNTHTGKMFGGNLGVRRSQLDPLTASLNPLVLALSADGRRAAVIDPLDAHQLWEIDFDKVTMRPVSLGDIPPATALAWIDEERLLLGCERDGSLHIACLLDGKLRVLRSFSGPLGERGQLFVSADGRHACVLNRKSPPSMTSLKDNLVFQPLGSLARLVTFSPDSRYLFWVDPDAAVHTWDLAGSREIRCYRQHASTVLKMLNLDSTHIHGLAVSPDGKVAMSLAGQGQVRLWKLDHELQP